MTMAFALITGTTLIAADRDEPDGLFAGFQSPPMESRPFFWWFWNGNDPKRDEIERQLDVMKDAGAGGVMIIPASMPYTVDDPHDPLAWLSDEWLDMLAYTMDALERRGMQLRLMGSTGWPYGGPWLEKGEWSQIVLVEKHELEGPMMWERPIAELLPESHAGGNIPPRYGSVDDYPEAPLELKFLRLYPEGGDDIEFGVDVAGQLGSDGILRLEVPAGRHVLAVGAWQEGWQHVRNGVPGGDGPVLDHMNPAATQAYLNHVGQRLRSGFGEELSLRLEAIVCDSLEEQGANWTTGFSDAFRERRGYDLEPFLPIVLQEVRHHGHPRAMRRYRENLSPRQDTIARVQYDINLTKFELFREGFAEPYLEWCRDLGVASMMEAYGRLWHELDGHLLPDIPTTETWLNPIGGWVPKESELGFTELRVDNKAINKYVTSGAHLAGRSEVACEAATSMRATFRATLDDLKRLNDENFITGINHHLYHTFNYSPKEAAFPGWVKFGSYFSERNPWWKHARRWLDYDARLSYVMQNSEMQAEIALLPPFLDKMSFENLVRQPEPGPEHVWYENDMWKAWQSNGFGVDYVSEKILREGSYAEGLLRYGSRTYSTVVVMDVKTMTPQAAEALLDHAEAGGRVIFIGAKPYRSPGYKNAEELDHQVELSVSRLFKLGGDRVIRVPSPKPDGDLVAWVRGLAEVASLSSPVSIRQPSAHVMQARARAGQRDLVFFANASPDESQDVSVTFAFEGKLPWRWDPETGERYPLSDYNPDSASAEFRLDPSESLLLAFESTSRNEWNLRKPKDRVCSSGQRSRALGGPWRLELKPVEGKTFSCELPKLIDFASDAELRSFGGTVAYELGFSVEDPSAFRFLSLGEVKGAAEVFLNGESLGAHWWGQELLPLGDALRAGSNELKIVLETTVFNYLKERVNASGWQGPRAWRHEYDWNPVGVMGPVRLMGNGHCPWRAGSCHD